MTWYFRFVCISVNEMLQTAKLFARRGSSLEPNASGNSKRINGLTFGEFCVLASDLKRFRTNGAKTSDERPTTTSAAAASPGSTSLNSIRIGLKTTTAPDPEVHRASAAGSSDDEDETPELPEVFLGGSCNPTTWRADVAIPALDKCGITFYNPVGFS